MLLWGYYALRRFRLTGTAGERLDGVTTQHFIR